MAERLLRRLRYTLLARTLRFPLAEFQNTSQGEIVSMVTQEVEPLGGFFGDAFVLIAFQGGVFMTILLFMFLQDPMIGAAALMMMPIQGFIVPRLQRKINALGKERVKEVRSLSGRIGEVVSSIEDVHANNSSAWLLSEISSRLGKIFKIRFELFQRKFFMKFVNNFINQLTPFFFYSIGGYQVIYGNISIGALVAALGAYKDLAVHWKELLNYYQRLADAKIKYNAVISQFNPAGMIDAKLFVQSTDKKISLNGNIIASGIGYQAEDGTSILEQSDFSIAKGSRISFVSKNGLANDIFAKIVGRLSIPTSGKIKFNGHDASHIPFDISGSEIGYLGASSIFLNASLEENMLLGLKQSTPRISQMSNKELADLREAEASGNSPHPFAADWTDFKKAGFHSPQELKLRCFELLSEFNLDHGLYLLGLRQNILPDTNPELCNKILSARISMHKLLHQQGLEGLIQNYDQEIFNDHASIGENLLFGNALDADFKDANLAENPIILKALDAHNMRDRMLEIGIECAKLMSEIFRDLPSGHPFFEQYSFVDEDILSTLKTIIRKLGSEESDPLESGDRNLLLSLPFKIIPQRHRLGIVSNLDKDNIVKLRIYLREEHAEIFETKIASFDVANYNPSLSILDNIMFGRLAHGQSDVMAKVQELVDNVCHEFHLTSDIINVALEASVGISGSKLSAAQRQKIAIVRMLLKRPSIIVIHQGLNALDLQTQGDCIKKIIKNMPDATLAIVGNEPNQDIEFTDQLTLDGTHIVNVSGNKDKPVKTVEVSQKMPELAVENETQLLKQIPFFSNLDANKLKLLAFTSDRLDFKAGDIIVKQGDVGSSAFVILSGKAEAVFEKEDGNQVVLNTISQGSLVGELAMLCETKRSATVKAIEPLVALSLNSEVFSELAKQNAQFSYQMARELGKRLLQSNETKFGTNQTR